MRLICILLLTIPVLLYGQAKNADQLFSEGLKKYAFESGQIEYELTGDGEGAEVMAFDKFGWRSMRKQSMVFELYGIKTIQTLHEITDGDFAYRLNEGDSSMISRKDYKWSQQAAYKQPKDVSEAILFSMGGTHVSDSTLLNKTCQVWTFENKATQELWIWEGLVLKRKTKLGEQIIYSTAINIKTDIDHQNILFEIPGYMKEKE